MADNQSGREMWNMWLDRSPASRVLDAGQNILSAEAQYEQWRGSLSPEAQDNLPVLEEEETVQPTSFEPAFWLVEVYDSDWPKLQKFPSMEALTRRVAALSGENVVVFAFHGEVLRVSQGPDRYVLTPGGRSAVAAPPSGRGSLMVLPHERLEMLMIQDDGFLGPVQEMANTNAPVPYEDRELYIANEAKEHGGPVRQKRKPPPDPNDDYGEHDDEAPVE